MSKLTLDEIADLRAYERGRDVFRREVSALKKLRRVAIGPLVTVVFENRTTMLFQIQEMVRAEKMATDEQVQGELDIYNPLIPEAGELSLTLFVELQNEAELRTWLPKLVGIERSLELRIGDPATTIAAAVDREHAAQLTRDEVTASVHYVRFQLDEAERTAFGRGPVTMALTHPAYSYAVELSDETRASLLADWQPD
ncbi:MAG: DUF3501 family protein [Acidimicrobiales bacterium]|jgi:hypothetical protein